MLWGATPEVEFLMLVDHAQVFASKLYLMGGGWDITYLKPDIPSALAGVVSVLIPWNATNIDWTVDVTVETPDGEVLATASSRLNQGRPNNAWTGEPQRTMLCFSLVVTFPQPGGYYLVGRIGDGSVRKAGFRVLARA